METWNGYILIKGWQEYIDFLPVPYLYLHITVVYLDDMMLFDTILDDHSLGCWGFMFLGDCFSANKDIILIEIDVKWSLEINFMHRKLSRFI